MTLLHASAAVLVARCRALDVRLWVEGDRLCYDTPGDLDDALRSELVAHKADLIALLTEAWSDPSAPPPAPRLDPFARLTRGPYRTAWGTVAWSDPSPPRLDLFGPPPDPG